MKQRRDQLGVEELEQNTVLLQRHAELCAEEELGHHRQAALARAEVVLLQCEVHVALLLSEIGEDFW